MFLVFKCCDQCYAIDYRNVDKLLLPQPYVKVPLERDFVIGQIIFDNQAVPVFEMCKILRPSEPMKEDGFIWMSVINENHRVIFKVDSVLGLYENFDINPTPIDASGFSPNIITVEENIMALVIDVDKFLEKMYE